MSEIRSQNDTTIFVTLQSQLSSPDPTLVLLLMVKILVSSILDIAKSSSENELKFVETSNRTPKQFSYIATIQHLQKSSTFSTFSSLYLPEYLVFEIFDIQAGVLDKHPSLNQLYCYPRFLQSTWILSAQWDNRRSTHSRAWTDFDNLVQYTHTSILKWFLLFSPSA